MLSGLKIKICGMRHPDNIAEVAALAPTFMGFIFWEGSPRCAAGLEPKVVASLPPEVTPVALFVNQSEDYIIDITSRYDIATVQLHGEESPEMCRRLRCRGLKVIKAIPIASRSDLIAAEPYDGVVDLFVFDTRTPSKGGSGRKFDWTILSTPSYPFSTPYLLSGGISPDDAEMIVQAANPAMAGIDLNSRFESAPAVKDIALLKSFINSLQPSI